MANQWQALQDLEEQEKKEKAGKLTLPVRPVAVKEKPTAEEAFGPETTSKALPSAEEAFGPEPKKSSERETMRNVPALKPGQELASPDLESPEYKKASTLTPEEEVRAASGRGTVYPLAGATAGGLLGHPVIGYALGRQAADLTNIAKGEPTEKSYAQTGLEWLGVPLPQEGIPGKVTEQALKVPEDLAVGKALEAGGKLAVKGAGTVAKKIPVIKNLPWVRDLPTFKPGQSQKIGQLQEKVGGPLKPSLAGQSAGEHLEIGSKEARDFGEQLYGTAKAGTKDVSFIGEDYKPLGKAIEEIKGSGDYKLLDSNQRKAVDNAIKYAKEKSKTSIGLKRGQFTEEQAVDIEAQTERQFGVPEPPEKSFETSEGLRKDLAQKVADEKGSSVGRLIRRLHNSVEDSQETAVKRQLGADSEAFKNWKQARQYYSEHVFGEGKGSAIAKFQKMSPEKRIDVLKRGSLDDLTKLRSAIGEEGFQSLKQGYVTDVVTRNENNPIKIAKELKGMLAKRGEHAEKIFDQEELGLIRSIGDPTRVQKYLAEHPKAKWLADKLGKGVVYYGIYRGLSSVGLPVPFVGH